MGNEVTVDLSNVFTNADNDILTITADKGIVTGTTWSYTPIAGDAGTTISVTLTANNGKGGTVQDTFTVTVAPLLKVEITPVSFGVAGYGEITGLTPGGTYSVLVDGITYGVLSDGSLTTSSSEPLLGTKIIGLYNTKPYKVFDSRVVSVTPSGFVIGDITGSTISVQIKDDMFSDPDNDISYIYHNSSFTGDFKNTSVGSIVASPNSVSLGIDGTVVNETGKATLTIPGEVFMSGRDLTIHFDTITQ